MACSSGKQQLRKPVPYCFVVLLSLSQRVQNPDWKSHQPPSNPHSPTLQILHIKMVIFLTEGRAHTYAHNGFSERSSECQSSSPASHKTEEEETSQQTAKRNKTKPIYRVRDSAVRFYTSSACISVHPNWMEQKLRQLGALRPTAALSL